MKILAIDTSTEIESVALLSEEELIGEYTFSCEVSHANRLMNTIELILKDSKLTMKDIDGLALSLGPGSFTGLRIGVSTVKGLALAAKKPVVGISTLDALALNLPFAKKLICPIIDATKGEVYTALYKMDGGRVPTRLTEDFMISLEALLGMISQPVIFTGAGIKTYSKLIHKKLGGLVQFPPGHLATVRASSVGQLGYLKLKQGVIEDLNSLSPIYIRPSEAEIKWREEELLTKVT